MQNRLSDKKKKCEIYFTIVICILLTFATVEIILRLAGKYRPLPGHMLPYSLVKSSQDRELEQLRKELPEAVKYPEKAQNYMFFDILDHDNDVGHILKKDAASRAVLIMNKKLIFDVQYSADQYRRRSTKELQERDAAKAGEDAVVFVGGSRTFGWGSNDGDTIASQFKNLNPKLSVYNYGIPAAGPNYHLKRFSMLDLKNEIPVKHAQFYYIFDYDHDFRAIGSSSTPWTLNYTHYELNEENNLIEYESRWQTHPLSTLFYHLVARSAIAQNLNLTVPGKISERNCVLLAKIFSSMQKKLRESFQDAKLNVVFVHQFDRTKQIVGCLAEENIESNLFNPASFPQDDVPGYYYEYDLHPMPITNKILAKKFSDLYNKKQE